MKILFCRNWKRSIQIYMNLKSETFATTMNQWQTLLNWIISWFWILNSLQKKKQWEWWSRCLEQMIWSWRVKQVHIKILKEMRLKSYLKINGLTYKVEKCYFMNERLIQKCPQQLSQMNIQKSREQRIS